MKTETQLTIDLTTDTGANLIAVMHEDGRCSAKGRSRRGGRWVPVLDMTDTEGPCAPTLTECSLARSISLLAERVSNDTEGSDSAFDDAAIEVIRVSFAALIGSRASAGKGTIRIGTASTLARELRGSIVSNIETRREEFQHVPVSANIVEGILAFESGDMNHEDTVSLFQRLLDTGVIHHLQGNYQRTMQALIDAGEVTVTSDSDPATGIEYGTAS